MKKVKIQTQIFCTLSMNFIHVTIFYQIKPIVQLLFGKNLYTKNRILNRKDKRKTFLKNGFQNISLPFNFSLLISRVLLENSHFEL